MRSLCCMLAVLLSACTVGPNYKRPSVTAPAQHRGDATPGQASLSDTRWPDLFPDATLKQLISTALAHNFDLALASERVEEARARYRISSANQYPFLYADEQAGVVRSSTIGAGIQSVPGSATDASYTQTGLALSWELDLWGRIRRLKESARAEYLATEEARRGVIVSLIGDVAGNYFTLRRARSGTADRPQHPLHRPLDQLDQLAPRSRRLHRPGCPPGGGFPAAPRHVVRCQRGGRPRTGENALNPRRQTCLATLCGASRSKVSRRRRTAGSPLRVHRPPADIRGRAEADLAQCQIGVAKANYFPQISLTGALGGQSRALTQLFTGPASYWTVAPDALLPIFTAGQVRVAVRLSEAQKREMLIAYQRTIYTAFREVSDALIRYDRTREQRTQQDHLVRGADRDHAPLHPPLPGRRRQLPAGPQRRTRFVPGTTGPGPTTPGGVARVRRSLPGPRRRVAIGRRSPAHPPARCLSAR